MAGFGGIRLHKSTVFALKLQTRFYRARKPERVCPAKVPRRRLGYHARARHGVSLWGIIEDAASGWKENFPIYLFLSWRIETSTKTSPKKFLALQRKRKNAPVCRWPPCTVYRAVRRVYFKNERCTTLGPFPAWDRRLAYGSCEQTEDSRARGPLSVFAPRLIHSCFFFFFFNKELGSSFL